MKTWIMFAIVIGTLAFGVVVLLTSSQTVKADSATYGAGCPLGGDGSAGCPYTGEGGCTQRSNCGLDTCAAKFGGGCGCGGAH